MSAVRLAALLLLLGGCAAQPTPSRDGGHRPPTGSSPVSTRSTPATERPSSAAAAGQLDRAPVVLRCPLKRRGCSMAVRVRHRDGATDQLVPSSFLRRHAPMLIDEHNAYWPGSAVRKRDLTRLDLDWRGARVRWLEQDDTHLVVVDEAGVYLLPKDGSPHRSIGQQADGIWSADASGALVAWTVDPGGGRPGEVVLARRDGTIVQSLSGENKPYGTRFVGDTLYWFNFGNTGPDQPSGAIRALRHGRPSTLAGGQFVPRDLTVHGKQVYWVTDGKEGRVARRVPLAGGTIERLGVSHELEGHRGNQDRILVHGAHVYWNAAHSVVRVPREGGDAEIVVTVDIPGDIYSFAIDATHLYVTAEVYRTHDPGR